MIPASHTPSSDPPPRDLSPNKQDPTNTVEGSHVDVEIDYFTINVFFDGTWNNMFNNNLYRLESKDYDTKVKVDGGTSYHREATGVEWLYKGYKQPEDDKNNIAVYVEGTGTFNGKKDSNLSAATGYGPTMGQRAKLERAFLLINEQLNLQRLTDAKFDVVKLNVYGFSRGAACARWFSNVARKEPERIKFDTKLTKTKIQLGFLGIFDTVSSVGVSHGNDTKSYEQKVETDNAVKDKNDQPIAFKVVHLTARNEARTYFSLYNIQSAVSKGYGLELSLPGCHTDIGGGLGVLEKKLGDNVVVVGRNEELTYVSAHRTADEYGRYATTDAKFGYNSEGKTDKAGWWIFDNAITRLLSQLGAKNNVDVRQMAERIVDFGYFKSFTELTSDSPEVEKNDSGRGTKKEALYLITQDSGKHRYQALKGYRFQLETGYSRVPCNIMLDFAKKYHADFFENFPKNEESKIPDKFDNKPDDFLIKVYEELKGKAFKLDDQCVAQKKGMIAELKIDEREKSRRLYNNYLHWSGDGGMMDVQLNPNGVEERTIYQANNGGQNGSALA